MPWIGRTNPSEQSRNMILGKVPPCTTRFVPQDCTAKLKMMGTGLAQVYHNLQRRYKYRLWRSHRLPDVWTISGDQDLPLQVSYSSNFCDGRNGLESRWVKKMRYPKKWDGKCLIHFNTMKNRHRLKDIWSFPMTILQIIHVMDNHDLSQLILKQLL